MSYVYHIAVTLLPVLPCIALLIAVYIRFAGIRLHGRTKWYAAGLLLFCAAAVLPTLSGNSFSALMAGHIIMLLCCGPLLVSGISAHNHLPPPLSAFSSFLGRHAWLPWLAGTGIMWVWHIPAVYNASKYFAAEELHITSILLAGILFCWPLFSPDKKTRLHPLAAVIYLFTACISCSLLGLYITFAPAGIYNGAGGIPICGGASASAADLSQQTGGLIMWVPCCLVYLAGCIYVLYRWFSEIPPIYPSSHRSTLAEYERYQ